MMHTPAEIVQQHLISESYGNSADDDGDWPTFYSSLPDDENEAICVYDAEGLADGRIQRTGETILHFGVQVRVRAKTHTEAWKKVHALLPVLDGTFRALVTVEETIYRIQAIHIIAPPVPWRVADDKMRKSFSVNCLTTIQEI